MNPHHGPTRLQSIEVDVECEACAHRFSFRHDLLGSTRSVYGMARRDEADRQLAAQVERLRSGRHSDLPPRPCPNCGAIQSWMLEAARRGAAERGGCAVVLILFVLALAALGLPGGPALDGISGLAVLLGSLGVGAVVERLVRRAWKPAAASPGSGTPPEIHFL